MKLESFLRNILLSRWYEHIPILYAWYEHSIKREVLKHGVPQHIAIIQDGNRRYAKMLGEATEKGHMRGADATERTLEWCQEIGVRQLTLYSFSTENFKRSEKEKKAIFELMKEKFRDSRVSERTHNNKLRIRSVGELDLLPPDMLEEIRLTDEATRGYDRLFLNIAIAYGGRQEIVDCARKLARDVKNGTLDPADIDESMIDGGLYIDKNPKTDVDLIIRTGGEERTSNFLPWQASGNECAFHICAPYWPEFRKIDFLRAIRAYQIREREHNVKMAIRMIKLDRQNGGVRVEDIRKNLSESLEISYEEADSILTSPQVRKELMKPA